MVFNYPTAHRDATVKDVLHGVEVNDPYRWLEDPDAEQTKKFVDEQNAITMPFIESCSDREKIKKRLTELWDYPKYGCTFKRGDNYFYYMNTGLQNQSVLYKQSSLDSEAEVFLDPNILSADGTTSINVASFSEDGKWFAYGLSDAGSDWVRIRIRNVESGEDLPEEIKRCKFTCVSWTHDNLGFFYAYYPEQDGKSDGTETVANEHQKLHYHRINTPQSEDVLVLEFPDEPKWRSGIEVSECGQYLHIFVRVGCQDVTWYYSKLPEKIGKLELTPIYTTFDAEFDFVTNDGETVYALTNKNAPNYRLIKFNLSNVDPNSWVDIVPENQSDVLEWVRCVNQNVLVLGYLRDVTNRIQLRNMDGSLIRELNIPIGTVSTLYGRRKQHEMFFQMTSFLTPGIIFHYDFNKHTEPQVFRDAAKSIKGFDSNEFYQEQVFYQSSDGQKIPMFIVSKKGTPVDGTAPCLLYGYGGFNISMSPFFSVSRVLWMAHLGGVFAVANIRGGSEYGQKWHDGGRLLNKQNCFNDFIAAAEYLVDNKYTSKDKLIIQGGSNGGFLVGACMNQRPDLFAVGIAQVGVMDLLRFHKFTIGHAWCTDYGNPEEKKEHFENLLKLSPLHNIPSNAPTYPATLLLTADHDDRVVPLHSLKFIANLQHTLGPKVKDKPLFIRVDTKAGHGAGKPTAKIIEEQADIYSFIENVLCLKYKD